MIEFFLIFGFFICPFILIAIFPEPSWIKRPRSFTMHGYVGGESSFRQRRDGTWYDSKTGKNLKCVSLTELMKELEDEQQTKSQSNK